METSNHKRGVDVMSKAFLVLDMPERCSGCILLYADEYDNLYCSSMNCTISDEIINKKEKHSLCPLKLLPQMKERSPVSFDYDGGYSHGIVHGHNEVIMKILEGINEQ